MLYRVRFKDGTVFNGGKQYKDTKWNEIPDKEILAITFSLPNGDFLTLKDYEEYNHFYEATQDVYGSNKFTLRYRYLLGRTENKVTSYRITLFHTKDDKYRIGDITRREYEYGKEYSGKPTKGWKKGVIKNAKSN